MAQFRRLTILTLIGLTLVDCCQIACALKPEIHHKFGEPEPRPPIAVTMFFTLLVASPALFLVRFWKSVPIGLDKLNTRRLIFHLVLLAILGKYIKFWLEK